VRASAALALGRLGLRVGDEDRRAIVAALQDQLESFGGSLRIAAGIALISLGSLGDPDLRCVLREMESRPALLRAYGSLLFDRLLEVRIDPELGEAVKIPSALTSPSSLQILAKKKSISLDFEESLRPWGTIREGEEIRWREILARFVDPYEATVLVQKTGFRVVSLATALRIELDRIGPARAEE